MIGALAAFVGWFVIRWSMDILPKYLIISMVSFVIRQRTSMSLQADAVGDALEGWRGDVRRADREVLRSGRDRCVQHEECGHSPIDRRRPCH
ncbi:MAG: hypothetical protein C5S41_04905 [Candidatus Methanomarinus sp.]|nr:MAG: hypothetical protein C5S41_04905 [ANME-2 cluster archaeon]KAF5427127.1 hypothetical protein C5S42_05800 [ANME-2 cluster archaeon]